MLSILLIISVFLFHPNDEGFEAGHLNLAAVFQLVSGETMKQVILEKAQQKLASRFNAEEYRFKLAARWIPRNILRADPQSIHSVDFSGAIQRYTNFEIVLQSENQQRSEEIQLRVDIERKLPVLNHRMESGSIIKSENIMEQWITVRSVDGDLVDTREMLEGKTLRTTILPGQSIHNNEISGQYLVEAGDVIQLIFEKQGVRIVLNAEARQSGAKNEEISIYSEETRKKYRGKIIASGIAKWIKTQ